MFHISEAICIFKVYPCCSMYQPNDIPLYEYNTFNLSVLQLMDIWVSLYFLPLVYNAGMSMCVRVLVWIPVFISLGKKYLGVELLGHMVALMFNLLRKCQTVFQSGRIIVLFLCLGLWSILSWLLYIVWYKGQGYFFSPYGYPGLATCVEKNILSALKYLDIIVEDQLNTYVWFYFCILFCSIECMSEHFNIYVILMLFSV